MNGINPIEIDKTAEYYNKLQEAFKEKINTKENQGSLSSNAIRWKYLQKDLKCLKK